MILILYSLNLHAQSRYEKRGDVNMSNSKYEEAIDNYSQDKRRTDNVNRKIANAYFKLGNYNKSERFLQKVSLKDYTAQDFLFYADINTKRREYKTAIDLVSKAKEKGIEEFIIQEKIDQIHTARNNSILDKSVLLKETILNIRGKGLGVTLFNDELIYSRLVRFSSKQKSKSVYQLYKTLYKTEDVNRGRRLSNKLDPKYNIGAISLAQDGKTVFYTRWVMRNNDRQVKHLMEAKLLNGEWVDVRRLNFCSKKYSTAYPCLSADGKSLYFSSNMPGGFGGMDIYKSTKINNKWSKPENIGGQINSSGNEIFPFIQNNKQIFFSSDGHWGLGGLDVFSSYKNLDTWSKPRNLSSPINSSNNDYSYVSSSMGDYTFFVTDRKDAGKSDRVYHIYKQVTDTIRIFVREAKSKHLLSDLVLDVLRVDTFEPVVCMPSKDGLSYEFVENSKDVDSQVEYIVSIIKNKYTPKKINFIVNRNQTKLDIVLEKENTMVSKQLFLDQGEFTDKGPLKQLVSPVLQKNEFLNEKYYFDSLYFKDNSFDLTEASLSICDKLISIMKLNPQVLLNVNAHAQSKENSFSLSEKMISTLQEYFHNNGIADKRLNLSSWGESFPLVVDETFLYTESNNRLELIIVL